jgi:hypothetical protein
VPLNQRESPYLTPLDQPVEVRWVNDDGVTMCWGKCSTRNEILDAWLDLGLRGVDPQKITCGVSNTPHMGGKKP